MFHVDHFFIPDVTMPLSRQDAGDTWNA